MKTGLLSRQTTSDVVVDGTVMPGTIRNKLRDLLPPGRKLTDRQIAVMFSCAQQGRDFPPDIKNRLIEEADMDMRDISNLKEELYQAPY